MIIQKLPKLLWPILFVGSSMLPQYLLADLIEMKNGTEVSGRYMGGSQTNFRFQVGEEIIVIPTSDVVTLTITNSPASPAAAPQSSGVAPVSAPPAPAFTAVTLPAGTRLLVRMADDITSKDRPGKRFSAKLEGDLRTDGVVVVPAGNSVYGRIEESKNAGNLAGRSVLEMSLTDIMVDYEMRPILTSEYSDIGKGTAGNTITKVGVGTGIGALAGGGDGAKVGAAVGLGAAAVTKGEQLSVPKGSLLEFRLTAPLTVRVPTSSMAAVQPAPVAVAVSGSYVTAPAGTRLAVRLIDTITSKDRPGKRFTAVLESDIKSGNVIIAPRGANVYGRLEEAKGAGNLAGKSVIEMTLTDIMINNELRPIMTNDYEEKGKNTAMNSAVKIGIGAGIGALIDGGDGAKKGAAVGLGVAAITKGEQLNVPANTLLEFRLSAPLTVRTASG